jgi:hypothetical protein
MSKNYYLTYREIFGYKSSLTSIRLGIVARTEYFFEGPLQEVVSALADFEVLRKPPVILILFPKAGH